MTYTQVLQAGRTTSVHPLAFGCKGRAFKEPPCAATLQGLSAQSLALHRSKITVNCESLAMKIFYLFSNSSINTVQLFFFVPKCWHTLMSSVNKPTVPYSLQNGTAPKQPCPLNKSLPIGEVIPFDFKNCTELNNLCLFHGGGIERFNTERKQTKKPHLSAAWRFKNLQLVRY